ncbi:SWR1-complex protein 5, partial [Tirmania nivea]
DDYHSEEDDDFDPDAVGSGDEDGEGEGGDSEDNDENMDSSSSEDENSGKRRRRRRRKGSEWKGEQPKLSEKKPVGKQTEKYGKDEEDDDEGSGESGDEGFGESAEESEGGEGGQVRTRAQRAKLGEKEKVPLASMQGATADVDRLWESMNQKKSTPTIEKEEEGGHTAKAAPAPEEASTTPLIPPSSEAPTPGIIGERTIINGLPHITISHTYTFAGITTTTTKLVPLDSAEARLFLSSHPTSSTTTTTTATATATTKPSLRRPLKRTSAFDSGPTAASKAKKINTLEKSRLDWAGFVDKEGIKEDLERQGKGGGYIDRQSFLGRVEERRE